MEGPKNGEKLLVPGARMETQAPQTVFRARDSVSRDAGAPLETSGGEAGQVQVRVAAEEQNRTGVGDSRPAVPVTHASGETAQNSGTEKAVLSAASNAFLQSSLQPASEPSARGAFDRFPASSPLSREPQTDKAELENRVGTRGAQEGLQGMQPPTTSFDLNEFGSNAGSSGEQGGALLSGGDTGAERMVATVSGAQISQPLTGSQGPVQGARPSAEVSRAELWDQIREMVQRVRSENPSHLSVEVRLQDGATVGIELRMRPTGLEASFRSESPALLRGLEAQWAGFLANEASGLQISHTAFESRSSLGNFADGGWDQREMREQMEDSAANAALSQRRNSGEGKNRNPGNSPRR
jgi:hypothetical protein